MLNSKTNKHIKSPVNKTALTTMYKAHFQGHSSASRKKEHAKKSAEEVIARSDSAAPDISSTHPFADATCVVPICVGTHYYENEKLKAILDVCLPFKQIVIIISGELYRYTKLINHLYTEVEALNSAREDGIAWSMRSKLIIDEYKNKDINIMVYSWSRWLLDNKYPEYRKRVEDLYITNPEFKQAFDNSVGKYLEDKHPVIDNEYAKKLSLLYLKEESAVFLTMHHDRENMNKFRYFVYPGAKSESLEITFKKLIKKPIGWLRPILKEAQGSNIEYVLDFPDDEISINRILALSREASEQDATVSNLYTKDDLKDAICDRNIGRVAEILKQRALHIKNGQAAIDLNSDYFNDDTGTALLWALCDSRSPRLPVSYEIIELLLAQRDEHNELVIDINYRSSNEFHSTLLDFIIDPMTNFAPESRINILHLILELNNADMSPAFDFSTTQLVDKALWKAVMSSDLELLSLGLMMYDVNQIVGEQTVLDYALSKNSAIYKYNQQIVDMIRNAGGLTGKELGVTTNEIRLLTISDYYKTFYKYNISQEFKMRNDSRSFVPLAQQCFYTNSRYGQVGIDAETIIHDDFKTANILDASSFRL